MDIEPAKNLAEPYTTMFEISYDEIRLLKIIEITEKTIVYFSHRSQKREWFYKHHSVFNTFEEAKAELIARQQKKFDRLSAQLETSKSLREEDCKFF